MIERNPNKDFRTQETPLPRPVDDSAELLDWLEADGNIDKVHCDAMSGPGVFFVDDHPSQVGLRNAIRAAKGRIETKLCHDCRNSLDQCTCFDDSRKQIEKSERLRDAIRAARKEGKE